MLVLTRKAGQSINIGADIIIRVFDIHNGSVKIGIEAPRELAVYREEIYEKLKEHNREAARLPLTEIGDWFKFASNSDLDKDDESS